MEITALVQVTVLLMTVTSTGNVILIVIYECNSRETSVDTCIPGYDVSAVILIYDNICAQNDDQLILFDNSVMI